MPTWTPLLDVLVGAQEETSLDDYERVRRPAAQDVIALTDQMTRVATVSRPVLRCLRNAGIDAVMRWPRPRRALARRIAQLAP